MKKIIAVLLAVIAVLCLSVPTFAETENPSPSGEIIYKVIVINGTAVPTEVKEGDTCTIKQDPTLGTFEYWEIFLLSDKTTKAVLGRDYEIVSGSLTTGDLVIRPLTDLYVVGHYKGGDKPDQPDEPQPDSPKTGETVALALAVFGLAALSIVFIKRKLAE